MLSMLWRLLALKPGSVIAAVALASALLWASLLTHRLDACRSQNSVLMQRIAMFEAAEAAQARTMEASRALQDRLDSTTRATADALRLRHSARACVSASAAATGSLNAAARAGASLPDTLVDGDALLQLGGDCQRAVELVRGWQEWYQAVSHP